MFFILRAAHYYQVSALEKACENYLNQDRITPTLFYHCVEVATNTDDPTSKGMKKFSQKMLSESLIKHDKLLQCTPEMIEILVSSNDCYIKEETLFEAVVRWAKYQKSNFIFVFCFFCYFFFMFVLISQNRNCFFSVSMELSSFCAYKKFCEPKPKKNMQKMKQRKNNGRRQRRTEGDRI